MQQTKSLAGINLLLNLSGYVDSRVSPSSWHSYEVARLTKNIAQKLYNDVHNIQSLYWAALFHDVGKVGVPDQILCKPGPLTDDEWRIMKLHPTIGASIVKSLTLPPHIASAIHYHQERYDGSGYPNGLSGDDIPLEARILAVVDAYEAMTSDRVYRKALRQRRAMEEIQTGRGKEFDPLVIDAFITSIS